LAFATGAKTLDLGDWLFWIDEDVSDAVCHVCDFLFDYDSLDEVLGKND
jgi:hypothetical protein